MPSVPMRLARPVRFAAFCLLLVLAASCARLDGGKGGTETVRVATFNIQELSAEMLQDVDAQGAGRNEQARAAAEIVRRVRPDILVLNEIDLDWETATAPGSSFDANLRRFNDNYLNHGANAIDYPYAYAAPSNTGLLSGFDLNNDGIVATEEHLGERIHGDDSFGYGVYPGQYAMGILSRYPLRDDIARTFQNFRWVDLPGHHIPPDFHSAEELQVFRLSSKSHWDVPVEINGTIVHLLVSHPTPPVFDGPEDRNGRRNFDEIKFWVHYLGGDEAIYDDAGGRGGLRPGASFVIAGDLNARPGEPPAYDGLAPIDQLLRDPRIQETAAYTHSTGAPAANPTATAEFLSGARVDYVLPSIGLELTGGGVYWPSSVEDPEGAHLAGAASDHRLVWIDLRF